MSMQSEMCVGVPCTVQDMPKPGKIGASTLYRAKFNPVNGSNLVELGRPGATSK